MAEPPVECPLCLGTDTWPDGQAGLLELSRLYRQLLSVDVAADLPHKGSVTLFACRSCFLKFYRPALPGGGEFYDRLQQFSWYYLSDKPEYHVALQYLPTEARVLEIGCGRGAFAELLPADIEYVGLEMSQQAADASRASGLDVRVESTSEHVLHRKGHYDAVVAFQVLEHVASPRNFIQDCVDLLGEAGVLIVSVPAEDGFVGALTNNVLNFPPHHATRWPDSTLDHLGKLFPLEMVALVPDTMTDAHRADYATELLVRCARLAPRPGTLLRSSRSSVLAYRVARRLGRRISRMIVDPRLQPRGHSVTAIARRQSPPVSL